MSETTKTFTAVAYAAVETGLSGKGVLVTGASGGIGSACARAFAAEGARVLVHYHRGEERARALAAELGGAPVAQADLTDEAAVDRLFAEARGPLGNGGRVRRSRRRVAAGGHAGVGAPARALERHDRPEPDGHLSHGACVPPRGGRTGHGSLVLVGSTAGLVGEAGHADYAAAKSAILGGLLLSLKNEVVRVAPAARVNAVAPGWTESPMTRGLVDPDAVRLVSRTMALRKIALPEDVAAQVVVLASDVLSGHVTGQVVTVAGGMEGRTIHED